jgi:hypothetical protein
MNSFKRASDIAEKPGRHSFPPEIKDVILNHLNNFNQPVTVTSALIELNKRGLNPSRSIIRRYLDKLVKSGYATVKLNGNIYEYKPHKKG